MRLTIESSGVSTATRMLMGLAARSARPKDALEAIADRLVDTIGDSLPRGSWQGLSSPYNQRRGGGPLQRSGDLIESLTTRGHKRHRRIITVDEIAVGTSHPLAHLHQHGTQQRTRRKDGRNAGRLPARPLIIPADAEKVRDDLGAIMIKHLLGRRRGIGL